MTLRENAFALAKLCARRFGIAVSYHPPPGTLDRHLHDFLSQMEINVVLDVGAFVGNYAAGLREIGYTGRIISFEPFPASYDQLHAKMRHDPLWSGQLFGLSDENREATLQTHDRGDFNSLLALRPDAERAYSLDSSRRGQATVQLRRLDALLPPLIEGVREPRVFLKMDTQGHDVSVVKGAAGVLDKIVGLQSEMPAVQIYDGMPSMVDGLNYYAGCGYVPVGFYAVNTLRGVGVSPEFDVLFKRFEGKLLFE